jgi:hypothetical protein
MIVVLLDNKVKQFSEDSNNTMLAFKIQKVKSYSLLRKSITLLNDLPEPKKIRMAPKSS